MDNQHKKITGYRDLTQAEIDLMNKIKSVGTLLEELVDEVDHHLLAETLSDYEAVRARRSPFRWSAMASTDFQTGLMALTRAVARPASY